MIHTAETAASNGHRWNYEAIKELAKMTPGVKVSDLIVLARNNDPFYVGTPTDCTMAEWFAELWQRFGYGWGVHLRRVHYQVVSQKNPVMMANGKPYENTEDCWNYLAQASKYARYLGMVAPGAFVDRRNPDPIIFANDYATIPDVGVAGELWGDEFAFPDLPDLPDYRIENFAGVQRYHLEIWCEKSTQNDVLRPLCGRYGTNLVTGVGEMSITSTFDLVQRIASRGKPARVFYVSDFDPAGKSMPVAVSRKAERFIRDHDDSVDCRIFPVVLTEAQVKRYQLPRTPIKDTEARKANFEDRFGHGAVELDALEALYPGELRKILAAELDRYFDHDLSRQVSEAKNQLSEHLDDLRDEVMRYYDADLEQLRDEWQAIRREFAGRMADLGGRVAGVWQAIHNELTEQAPDLADYPIPEASTADELPDALFDSGRTYLDQLQAYKQFQRKETEPLQLEAMT